MIRSLALLGVIGGLLFWHPLLTKAIEAAGLAPTEAGALATITLLACTFTLTREHVQRR